jgi:glycosyltransferase involved in cell wall biosynthesis
MGDHPTVVLATPAWSLNGPNVFSRNLARGLLARKIPAHIVITRPDWLDAKPLPLPLDIPMEVLPVHPFMSLRCRWKAMMRHLEERAPCIYVPNYDFRHSCISPRLSSRVAIVGIVHSDDPPHYDHVARLGKHWNAIVAVSSTIADEVLKLDPSLSRRISMIPYGVASAAAFPDRASRAQRSLRVIYAGRLDQPQKRVLDIPKIVKAAAELGVPVHLTVAGSGPAETQLRSMCAVTRASVDFLGTLDGDALAEVFAQQDVFLLTSAFEGLPIGVLEAMGQGCIPVVTDIRSGVPEVVADGINGFRIAAGDIEGFAEHLGELYDKPEMRRKMAEAAYSTVRSTCYCLDSMVQRYVDLFGKVLDDVRSRTFQRPAGSIRPPKNLPWQEYLPEHIQKAGSHVKRLLAIKRT